MAAGGEGNRVRKNKKVHTRGLLFKLVRAARQQRSPERIQEVTEPQKDKHGRGQRGIFENTLGEGQPRGPWWDPGNEQKENCPHGGLFRPGTPGVGRKQKVGVTQD